MSIVQQLTEFRFNLETLDLLNNMGKTSEYSTQMLGELGLSSQLIKFMQTYRMLLNSVLLRLQLYSEQNLNEQKIRGSLAILNNPSVSALLDYLYKSSSVSSKKSSSSPPPTPIVEPEEEEVDEVEEAVEEAEDNEESHFDSFFLSCVRQSDDASHTVKMSAMYDAFSKWWANHYEDETPTKDELKEYLSDKLGHTIKSIVSNVSLA
jgi:hypothetical protein